MASDADARYDDRVALRRRRPRAARDVGHQPGAERRRVGARAEGLDVPPESARADRRGARVHGLLAAARRSPGTKIDVAFIGSCTNGRLSDLREAARVVEGPQGRDAREGARRAGLERGARPAAEKEGLDAVFRDAGFEWRGAGCSMCLAMNPDRLEGRQVCASSSNRNFKGRQGSPTGRTLLMSPAMVAAAALAGEVADVRPMLGGGAMTLPAIRRVAGTALPLRGDDIDTDRIIPARFLVSITFEGLGAHAFEDDRQRREGEGRRAPLRRPALLGRADPPREPQLRLRLVARARAAGARPRAASARSSGESFSEIFFGNSVAIGLPCVTLPRETLPISRISSERDPKAALSLDLEARTLIAEGKELPSRFPRTRARRSSRATGTARRCSSSGSRTWKPWRHGFRTSAGSRAALPKEPDGRPRSLRHGRRRKGAPGAPRDPAVAGPPPGPR